MGLDMNSKYNQLISLGKIHNKNFTHVFSIVTILIFRRWKIVHYNWNVNGRGKKRGAERQWEVWWSKSKQLITNETRAHWANPSLVVSVRLMALHLAKRFLRVSKLSTISKILYSLIEFYTEWCNSKYFKQDKLHQVQIKGETIK
jgi:hypothetical protein